MRGLPVLGGIDVIVEIIFIVDEGLEFAWEFVLFVWHGEDEGGKIVGSGICP